jgi:arsenite methyltransferase
MVLTSIDFSKYQYRMTSETIHDMVRERYAAAAIQASEGCCAVDSEGIGPGLYSALERDELPDAAVLASLGCGNPVAVAELHEGERVLDLGSGGGIDVLLSAKRVGPTGRAFGVDMTDEMLALAQRNAAEAGATNVEFLKGHIEATPLPANSIDVVISNCVINLAADKPAVFREIARVLRPGGRMGVSDILADDGLTADERAERGSYTGCIAGALSFDEFERGLVDAGLVNVEITPTHFVADRMASCIVRAVKPGGAEAAAGAEVGAGAGAGAGAAGADAASKSKLRIALEMLPIKASDGSCCGGDGCC